MINRPVASGCFALVLLCATTAWARSSTYTEVSLGNPYKLEYGTVQAAGSNGEIRQAFIDDLVDGSNPPESGNASATAAYGQGGATATAASAGFLRTAIAQSEARWTETFSLSSLQYLTGTNTQLYFKCIANLSGSGTWSSLNLASVSTQASFYITGPASIISEHLYVTGNLFGAQGEPLEQEEFHFQVSYSLGQAINFTAVASAVAQSIPTSNDPYAQCMGNAGALSSVTRGAAPPPSVGAGWGGIERIVIDGVDVPLSQFTSSSGSGFNYFEAATPMPAPGGIALLALTAAPLANRRRWQRHI